MDSDHAFGRISPECADTMINSGPSKGFDAGRADRIPCPHRLHVVHVKCPEESCGKMLRPVNDTLGHTSPCRTTCGGSCAKATYRTGAALCENHSGRLNVENIHVG